MKTHEQFLESKDKLTEALAKSFTEIFQTMGPEKVKEISWFNIKKAPIIDSPEYQAAMTE